MPETKDQAVKYYLQWRNPFIETDNHTTQVSQEDFNNTSFDRWTYGRNMLPIIRIRVKVKSVFVKIITL